MLANSPIPSLKPSRHYSIVEQLVLSCPELIYKVGNLAHFREMNGFVSEEDERIIERVRQSLHTFKPLFCVKALRNCSFYQSFYPTILKFHTAIYKNYSTANYKFMKLLS